MDAKIPVLAQLRRSEGTEQAGSISNQPLTLLNNYSNLHPAYKKPQSTTSSKQTNKQPKTHDNFISVVLDIEIGSPAEANSQSQCKGKGGSIQTGMESKRDVEGVTPSLWHLITIWFSSAVAEKCPIWYSCHKFVKRVLVQETRCFCDSTPKLPVWDCWHILVFRNLIRAELQMGSQSLSWGAGDWQKLSDFCKQKAILCYIFSVKNP